MHLFKSMTRESTSRLTSTNVSDSAFLFMSSTKSSTKRCYLHESRDSRFFFRLFLRAMSMKQFCQLTKKCLLKSQSSSQLKEMEKSLQHRRNQHRNQLNLFMSITRTELRKRKESKKRDSVWKVFDSSETFIHLNRVQKSRENSTRSADWKKKLLDSKKSVVLKRKRSGLRRSGDKRRSSRELSWNAEKKVCCCFDLCFELL